MDLKLRVWLDSWIPGNHNFKPTPRSPSILVDNTMLVSELFDSQTKLWNLELLKSLFDDESISNIMKIYLPQNQVEGEFIWIPNNRGTHFVKTFYLKDQDARFSKGKEEFWNKLWKLKIHSRLKLHLWRIAKGCLSWANKEDNLCPLYKASSDSYMHLFVSRAFSRIAWRESERKLWHLPINNMVELIGFIAKPPNFPLGDQEKKKFSLYGAVL